MMAVYVEAKLTPMSFAEVVPCFRQGIHVATGQRPSNEALALCLGKTALETGRWQRMYNYAFGNIKAGEKYAGMYCCYPCNEVIGGKVVWFSPEGALDRKGGDVTGLAWAVPPGHPQTRFRAYANGYDGAQQYASFVALGRYREAWDRLLDGDAAGYVHELKKAGYFTADEATYLRGVDRLYREFLPLIADAERDARGRLDTLDDSVSDTDPAPPPSGNS